MNCMEGSYDIEIVKKCCTKLKYFTYQIIQIRHFQPSKQFLVTSKRTLEIFWPGLQTNPGGARGWRCCLNSIKDGYEPQCDRKQQYKNCFTNDEELS